MISCEQHDHIEIVCTYQFPIKLSLKSGLTIKGIAKDTCLDEHRAECIKVKQGESITLVVLEQVLSLEVCVENPFFKSISFG